MVNNDEAHPAWCGGEPAGCTGIRHKSVEAIIPYDDYSGIALGVTLRSGACLFVELMMSTECGPEKQSPEEATASDTTYPYSYDRGGAEVIPAPLQRDPGDPIFITDSHPHDLTLDQARDLHDILGHLLTRAEL